MERFKPVQLFFPGAGHFEKKFVYFVYFFKTRVFYAGKKGILVAHLSHAGTAAAALFLGVDSIRAGG